MLKRSEHKKYATVFWVLSVVCMGVIFYLSSRTADQSSRESGAVLAWLTRLLGDGRLTDFLVRKSAHFLEYTGLCLLLSFACAATWGRRYTAVSLPIASLHHRALHPRPNHRNGRTGILYRYGRSLENIYSFPGC